MRVVTDLDDDLYNDFIKALGDVPISKILRRWIREFVDKSKAEAKK